MTTGPIMLNRIKTKDISHPANNINFFRFASIYLKTKKNTDEQVFKNQSENSQVFY